ncbi:Tetracyclin repressor, C-terminal all-alpha domain [Streptomyces noursei ATCC 11455]|uniref:TetR/AcrR family transcriptional regulator C-terminal domain-containing protein n=1 Tax=Streptomyces noursei TaxID=1971 RepID=UPI00081CBCEC|nr:Tetracyclin repressor, C-terminal all-alpha domain [Streptomyces noursei ATCC 11455]
MPDSGKPAEGKRESHRKLFPLLTAISCQVACAQTASRIDGGVLALVAHSLLRTNSPRVAGPLDDISTACSKRPPTNSSRSLGEPLPEAFPDRLKELSRRSRAALLSHRDAARMVAGVCVAEPHTLRYADTVIATLLAAGHSHRTAAWTHSHS